MRTILLADDDASNRSVLAALLEDYGLNVVEAASFAAAKAALAGDHPHYDVALLDQHLGDGLGLDLVPDLRALAPGITIILISGSMDHGGADTRGVDHVATKGLPFSDLLAIIGGEAK